MTNEPRLSGSFRFRVDKAALVYDEAGHTRFFGTPDLVKYLASRGVPRWTHTLGV